MKRLTQTELRKKNQKLKKKILPYKSVIDKWLHYDRTFKKSDIRDLLGFDNPMEYESALATPHKYFTIYHMEKISQLTGEDLAAVFWACYKRKTSDIGIHKVNQSISRLLK